MDVNKKIVQLQKFREPSSAFGSIIWWVKDGKRTVEFCEDEGIIRYRYGSNGLSLQSLKSERNSKEKVVKKRAKEDSKSVTK